MNGRFTRITDAELLNLVFGCYSAFVPERAAVLMFHLERTVRQNLESHQPTEGEVLHGLYDQGKHQWIGGPAGVSLDTWRRINSQLDKEGLIQATKKSGEITEYTPQLAAIRLAIQAWRERPAPRGGQ